MFDPNAEYNLLRKSMIAVGKDRAAWKSFLDASAGRRDMLAAVAPALHSKLDAELRAKGVHLGKE